MRYVPPKRRLAFNGLTPCSPLRINRRFGGTYRLNLKNMDVMCSSETSAGFQCSKRRYIPKDRTLRNHRCDNLRSYMNYVASNGEMSDA
jgi:hypothetical protein